MGHNFEANSEQVVTLVSVTNRNKTIFRHIRSATVVVSDLACCYEILGSNLVLVNIFTFLTDNLDRF
jgi:hypothetical protein